MPITVRCPGCNAVMKVKDELAGRRIKCPKCGEVIPAPPLKADPDAAPAPAPAPAATRKPAPPADAPAPARDPAAETPKSPRAPKRPAASPEPRSRAADEESPPSFEDLGILSPLRERVEKAIGDEVIVWMGRPDPDIMAKKYGKIGMIAGGAVTLIGLAIIVFLFVGGLDGIMMAVGGLFGAIFLLAGVALFLTPMWIKMFAKHRAVYVLTDQRAVVCQNKMGRFDVHSYKPNQLRDMELKEQEDGSGSIVMEYTVIQRITKVDTKNRTILNADETVMEGGKEKAIIRNEGARIPLGFLDIPDVASIHRLISTTLRLDQLPKASRSKEV